MLSNQFTTPNTKSSVMSKKDFQALRRRMIDAGMPVAKVNGGYECRSSSDGLLVLKAMNGTRGYLVRYCEELFEKE